jgi:ankyrin repeat protein
VLVTFAAGCDRAPGRDSRWDSVERDNDRATPAREAAARGQTEVANLLLEHGADVNAMDADAQTLLHVASIKGHADVADVLIERGADRRTKGGHGDTTPASARAEELRQVLRQHGTEE